MNRVLLVTSIALGSLIMGQRADAGGTSEDRQTFQVAASFDDVWKATTLALAKIQFVIKDTDKAGGRITASNDTMVDAASGVAVILTIFIEKTGDGGKETAVDATAISKRRLKFFPLKDARKFKQKLLETLGLKETK